MYVVDWVEYDELYIKFLVSYIGHPYNLLKFIRFTMNDSLKLFEEFYESHIARNSRFILPSVRLDVEKNYYTIFQNIKCFNVSQD